MMTLATLPLVPALVALDLNVTDPSASSGGSGAAPPGGARSTEISVLTYNVRGLPWPLAGGRAKALKAIGAELATMRRDGRQPDVVLIQEGFRGEVGDLVEASGYHYWARGPSRSERASGAGPENGRRYAAVRYPSFGEGWGKGDAVYACDARTGNCTDFHSYFIALARSVGIPARFAIGAAIPSERNDGGVDGYHCWAEFFADGKWWPVDISEGNKYTGLATYYFGRHPANRMPSFAGPQEEVAPHILGVVQHLNRPTGRTSLHRLRDHRQGLGAEHVPHIQRRALAQRFHYTRPSRLTQSAPLQG